MFDWAFAQRGYGVFALQSEGQVVVLEYNEFLRRIASGAIGPDDSVFSRVYTDGWRRRVGDLRIFAMIRSGNVRTDDLPLRTPNGVLASGDTARALLDALETERGGPAPNLEEQTLLRASPGIEAEREALELLHPAVSDSLAVSKEESLRSAAGPQPDSPLPLGKRLRQEPG